MSVYFVLDGFKELDAIFKDMEEQVKRPDLLAKNVFKPAITDALQPALQYVKDNAPYDNDRKSDLDAHGRVKPHLRDTAKIETRFPNPADKRSQFIKDTDTYIGTVTVKKSAVSLSQEFGNARTPPHPFIRNAFDRNAETIINILKSKMSETMPAYLTKLNRYKGLK